MPLKQLKMKIKLRHKETNLILAWRINLNHNNQYKHKMNFRFDFLVLVFLINTQSPDKWHFIRLRNYCKVKMIKGRNHSCNGENMQIFHLKRDVFRIHT